MSRSIPPYGALFSFMNEEWEAIGWANGPNRWDCICCHKHDAAFVIGRNVDLSRLTNCIAPIDQVGMASRNRDWQYKIPDFIRISEGKLADENAGRRVRILSGKLDFY